jgi:hypothetical protein
VVKNLLLKEKVRDIVARSAGGPLIKVGTIGE